MRLVGPRGLTKEGGVGFVDVSHVDVSVKHRLSNSKANPVNVIILTVKVYQPKEDATTASSMTAPPALCPRGLSAASIFQ